MTRRRHPLIILSALLVVGLATRGTAQERKWVGKSVDFSHGRLTVSENHRYLVFENGTPFFWLGDTAWELFHRLTKEEAERYLEYFPETEYIVATRAADYVMVYLPVGKSARLDLSLCGWPEAIVWWYDCRTGEATRVGEIETNQVMMFDPETLGRGNNWVLILDNASKPTRPPGQ